MVDNVVADQGTGGAIFATDEISTVHYPLNKLGFGALDSFTIVSPADGLPVELVAGTALIGKVDIGAPDTGALDLAKIEDSAHSSGDVGIMALGVRNDALVANASDGNYVPFTMNENGALWVNEIPSVIDSGNSTTTPLGIGATFTGVAVDLLEYAAITILIDSDVDGASDGISLELSTDGTNWDSKRVFSYTAAFSGKILQEASAAQFFRLVYINGGTGQTTFRVQTILHTTTPIAGTHRLVDDEDPDTVTLLNKSAIIAQRGGSGEFIPIQSTMNGSLKVSIEESNGNITGGGTEATALRVTVANDSTGLLNVINPGTFAVQIDNNNLVSTDNSSSDVLAGAAVFTGTSEDISTFASVSVQVFASHASATDGLSMEFSTDGTNWDEKHTATIMAGTERAFIFPAHASFFRIVYTNGATLQTAFRLQTILHVQNLPGTAHALDESAAADDVGVLTKSVIVAQAAGAGDFDPVQATAGGNLKVSIEEFDTSLPTGSNTIGNVTIDNNNVVSTDNSTTSTLTSASTYTGTGEDVSNYAMVTIMLDASHDSAVDGMTFQFSTDNTNWDDVFPFTYIAANGARRFELPTTGRYFRVVYTNGGTGQTHFRVQTILHVNTGITTVHRLSDDVHPDGSAELTKAVIIAQAAGTGDFISVQSTAAGNLKTSTQEISDGLDIGAGNAGSETQRVSISTDDVNLSAIKTAIELLDNAVSGAGYNITQMNGVNVTMGNGVSGTGVQRVSIASNSTGQVKLAAGTALAGKFGIDQVTANANKVVTKTGSLTKLEANDGVDIGDVDVASQPARVATTDNVGAAIQTNQLMDGTTSLTPKYAAIDVGAAGDNTLVALVSGKKIRVLQVTLIATAAVNVRFESGAAGSALTGQMALTANSGFEASFCPVGLFETASGVLLNLELSSAVPVDGWLVYVEV